MTKGIILVPVISLWGSQNSVFIGSIECLCVPFQGINHWRGWRNQTCLHDGRQEPGGQRRQGEGHFRVPPHRRAQTSDPMVQRRPAARRDATSSHEHVRRCPSVHSYPWTDRYRAGRWREVPYHSNQQGGQGNGICISGGHTWVQKPGRGPFTLSKTQSFLFTLFFWSMPSSHTHGDIFLQFKSSLIHISLHHPIFNLFL